MNKLIDAEAAVACVTPAHQCSCEADGGCDACKPIINAIRALPAAVSEEASAETEVFADIVRRTADALGKPRTGKGSSWHDIPECVAALKAAMPTNTPGQSGPGPSRERCDCGKTMEACADTEDCDNQSQPGSSTPTCATCGYGCHRGQERRLRDVLVCRACACPSCRPAAVPVVDVEKAAKAYGGTLYEHTRLGNGNGWAARAILSAGYAGSVSKEDVRMVAAELDDQFNGIRRMLTPKAKRLAEACKRLLAATEGE